MDVNLIVDVARNIVLNADGITALRSITLIQGTTYIFRMAYYANGVVTTSPTIVSFDFKASNGATTILQSVALTNGNTFQLIAASDALTTALGTLDAIVLTGQISWNDGISNTEIAPFSIRVESTDSEFPSNVVAYATTSNQQSIMLDADSPLEWFVDATLSDASFILPNVNAVAGRCYRFTKIEGGTHAISVTTITPQIIKSFIRLTTSDNGQTVSVTHGTFTDNTISTNYPGDAISVIAVGGSWIS